MRPKCSFCGVTQQSCMLLLTLAFNSSHFMWDLARTEILYGKLNEVQHSCYLKELVVHSPWERLCCKAVRSTIWRTELLVKQNFFFKSFCMVFWRDGSRLPTLSLPHFIFLLNYLICIYNTGEKMPCTPPTLLILDSWDFAYSYLVVV